MTWCLLVTPSRALSQKEALQMQSLPSSEQTYLYGLPGPREGIKLCASNIYLVGAEKAMLHRE